MHRISVARLLHDSKGRRSMKFLTALGLALAVLAFALGLPLLGWGIADWRGFFSSPVRLLYGVGVALQSLSIAIGYLALPFPYSPGKREGQATKRIARQSVVPIVTRLIWLSVLLISA